MCNISVVIPAYNVESYIADTLTSILSQTLKPYEVIVIDDGSTDSTLQIVNEFFTNTSIFLKVISTKNQGLGEARNCGIKHADGDYIYFLDSDDIVKPNFISAITEKILENNFPDIIFFEAESFKDNDLIKSTFSPDYIRQFSGSFNNRSSFISSYLKHKSFSSSACLYITKLSTWKNTPLKFCSFHHEDEDIFHQLVLSSNTFLILNESYYLRRIRDGSIMTQNKNSKHALGIESVLDSTSYEFSVSNNSLEKKFLKSRAYSFIYTYFRVNRQAGRKKKLSKVTVFAWRFRSPYILAKTIYYNFSK